MLHRDALLCLYTLELPLSMTPDYALFNFLQDHSIDLWQREIENGAPETWSDQLHCSS